MLLTFGCMVWGLTGDCPYRPEFDEALSVSTALNMVKTGDPNPHWLAHPGSTLIYPLALYFHFLNSALFHGAISSADFDVQKFMYENVFVLFYIPRYLNVFLFVASIPQEFYVAQTTFAWLGIAIAFCKRQFLAITLAVYTLAILVGTSLHAFHAVKWLVPAVPMFSLFAGSGLAFCGAFAQQKLAQLSGPKLGSITYAAVLVISIFSLEYEPFLAICRNNYARSYISTDIQFYEWFNSTIPHGTPVCFVGVWEGGHKSDYKVLDVLWDPSYFDHANGGKYQSPFDIYDQGYKYFIWTDNHCPLYLAEPKKIST